MVVGHVSVLLDVVISYLEQHPSLERVVDATLGLGGYSEAILARWDKVEVRGIDQDPDALAIARERLVSFGTRFRALQGNFRQIQKLLSEDGFLPVDAVLFDLGVSNLHLSLPERGFSFNHDGPLDMRMDKGSNNELTAAEILNTWSPGDIFHVLKEYGEEPHASLLTKILVRGREKNGPYERTADVVALLRKELPAPLQRKMGTHPARRLFQALRIAVNDELGALRDVLAASPALSRDGTMVVFVSYHSLEDRMVKQAFRAWEQDNRGAILTKKPLQPAEEEIDENAKSRSAKMRVFVFGEGRQKRRNKYKKEEIEE